MNEAVVRVKLLREGARLPARATTGSSGFDLYACLDGPVELGQRPVAIPTGLAMQVPAGFDAQIRPRSGLAKKGVIATFGTLDADYRGELMVTLYTTAAGIEHTIQHGDRVGQLVITHLVDASLELADSLDDTGRGVGGHGSTGR